MVKKKNTYNISYKIVECYDNIKIYQKSITEDWFKYLAKVRKILLKDSNNQY